MKISKSKFVFFSALLLLMTGCGVINKTADGLGDYLAGKREFTGGELKRDWYYSSEVESKFDKFEGSTTISISPINIGDESGSKINLTIFSIQHAAEASKNDRKFIFLYVIKNSRRPILKDINLKIESGSNIYSYDQLKYIVSSRVSGSGYASGYSSSYSESEIFDEAASYKVDASLLCSLKDKDIELKVDRIYVINKSYVKSIRKLCSEIDIFYESRNIFTE